MNISLWIRVQLKLSIILINIVAWNWHFLLAIFSKFSQLSSGVGTLIFQGNFPSLQNQDFSTIGTTKEPSLMLFLSKTRTSIIHGYSISCLSINFPFLFGSTVGRLILDKLLRFSQNPSWMALSYSKVHLLSQEKFQLFPNYYFFLASLVLFGQFSGTISLLQMNQQSFHLFEGLLRLNGGTL